MTAGESLLEVRDLEVRYGKVAAVRGVSLRVERGRIATVIGPNGAGKSTLLAAVAGLLRPAAGAVVLDGRPVTGAPVEENAARGLALVPETRELFAAMSVEDNLVLGSFALPRAGRAERRLVLDEVYGVGPQLRARRNGLLLPGPGLAVRGRAPFLPGPGPAERGDVGRAVMRADGRPVHRHHQQPAQMRPRGPAR